jgi:hypothetical protein
MEEVRVKALDNICVSIAETRESINDLKAEEVGLETNALALMRKNDRTSYRHSGVELFRVPGEEKLRVRTARERTATAESPEAETEVPASERGEEPEAVPA